jgi:formate hydrogenlyase subunit 3/multisubunit Na+/H+ antiporter MnhD subunit
LAAGVGAITGRVALLEIASILVLILIWRTRARWTYLAVVVASGAALIVGDGLLEAGDPGWARALLTTGFLLKLAAVPFLFWLLRVAEDVPAAVLGLIIAVLDIAVFAELYSVAQAAPWILTPHGLWLGIGIGSALGGSILMLSQRSLKRLLVLSTVEDIGFLLLGVSSASQIGMSGALIGAAVHAVAKALLFVSISAPEADGALDGKAGALATRYPLSAAGFLFGMLAMLGVPPLMGFAGRWRLYETAAQAGPVVLVAFIASSAFSLIAYTLALTRIWWGPDGGQGPGAPPIGRGEPLGLRATIVLLAAILVLAGLWPNLLRGLL